MSIVDEELVKTILNRIKTMAKKIPKTSKHVPFTSLVGKAPVRPIFGQDIQDRLDEATAPITGEIRWRKWGMAAHSTCLLFHGPPGCGKTTAARWLAKKVSNGIIEITMADVGGGNPGDTERGTREIFAEARKRGNCSIFIDECDGMLIAREKLGPDSMWMLTVINAFMSEIEQYPGLVMLATNMPQMLDAALRRRITDMIEIPKPCAKVRVKLWEQKIPNEYPIHLDEDQAAALALVPLTGAEIEMCIDRESRRAIRLGRNPKFESLLQIAQSFKSN